MKLYELPVGSAVFRVALILPRRSNFRVRATSLPTTGANTAMSIPSVALENTAVPDISMDEQSILVLPRLSARSPARPAAPVDVAPAPPPSSVDYRAAGQFIQLGKPKVLLCSPDGI